MKPLVLISTTFENTIDAERMASLLVDQKLIACAQISSPITSIYKWEGEIVTEIEYTLTVKSLTIHTEKVKERIIAGHPYETPEIIVTLPVDVHSEYLKWVNEELIP